MKNKLSLIDVSILSSYMGKALTLFVTLFVVGIAASALIHGGGVEKNVVRVYVPAGPHPGEAVERFEPLRSLLVGQTRRPVTLVECAGDWPRGGDLYVMPVGEYLRREGELGVSAIYEVGSSERRLDKAVLVALPSGEPPDLSSVSPEDVVFVHPASVNGFLVQANALFEAGWEAGGGFRFEGVPRDATRVILGVAVGAFRLGACPLAEVTELSRRGVVGAGELRVVAAWDALPEMVVAVKTREARYFEAKIAAIAALLKNESSAPDRRDAVRLLKTVGVCRLDRLERERIDEVRRLFDRFAPPLAAPR